MLAICNFSVVSMKCFPASLTAYQFPFMIHCKKDAKRNTNYGKFEVVLNFCRYTISAA